MDPEGEGVYYHYITSWSLGFKRAYLLGMGEFGDLLGMFDLLGWLLFLIATFFLIIVMMNLLVGVISNAIEVVGVNRHSNTLLELASLTRDVHSFMKRFKKEFSEHEDEYLYSVSISTRPLENMPLATEDPL